MNEMDLNVKVVIDKSSVKSDLNEIKQDLGSVSDKAKSGAQSASSQVINAVNGVKNAVRASIGASLVSLLSSTSKVKEIKQRTKEDFKDIKKEIKDFRNTFKKNDDDRESIFGKKFTEKLQDFYKNFDILKKTDKKQYLQGLREAFTEYDDVLGKSGAKIRKWLIELEIFKEKIKLSTPVSFLTSNFTKLQNTIKDSKPWQSLLSSINKVKASKLGVWFTALGAAIKMALGQILAIVAVITGLGALLTKITNGVSRLGDEIDKGSQRLNMTTSQYQKWSYAMELCGSSIEELREGYNQMSTKVSQAINGTEDSAKAFKDLGVNIYDSNNQLRSTGDIFEDTIKQLQQIENPTKRTAAAQKIFGESTAKLNPLLNAEAGFLDEVMRTQRALNSEMSGGLVAASAKYRDSITTMKQAWQGLKNTLAETLLPVLQRVVVWITVAVAKINILLRAIFGLKKSEPMAGATKSTDGFTTSVGKASKAVEKLKRQVMGFDEMNILQGKDSSGGDTDVGGGVDLSGLEKGGMASLLPEDALRDLEEFEKKINSIVGKSKGWAAAIAVVGGALLLVIGCMSLNIPMILAGAALFGIGLSLGKGGGFSSIADQLDSLTNGKSRWIGALLMITGAGLGVVGLITMNPAMIVSGLALAGVGLSVGFGGFGSLANYLDNLTNGASKWVAALTVVAGAIMLVIGLATLNLPMAAVGIGLAGLGISVGFGGINGLVDFIGQIFEKIKKTVSNALKSITGSIKNWWNNLNPMIKGYLTAVGGFFTAAFGAITFNGGLIRKGLDIIKDGVSEWWNSLSTQIQNIIKGVGGVFQIIVGYLTINTGLINKGLENIGIAITGKDFPGLVKGIWDSITKWWTANVSPKFTNNFWAQKFDSIRQGARSAFNGVIGVVEKAINFIIRKLNTLHWKIPSWVPALGGKSFGFNFKTVSIPRLATGGIATRSTFANVGENGKEAILPLENNTQWMDKLAEKLAARSTSPTKLVLMVDKKVLAEASIEGINDITRATGQLQLRLV